MLGSMRHGLKVSTRLPSRHSHLGELAERRLSDITKRAGHTHPERSRAEDCDWRQPDRVLTAWGKRWIASLGAKKNVELGAVACEMRDGAQDPFLTSNGAPGIIKPRSRCASRRSTARQRCMDIDAELGCQGAEHLAGLQGAIRRPTRLEPRHWPRELRGRHLPTTTSELELAATKPTSKLAYAHLRSRWSTAGRSEPRIGLTLDRTRRLKHHPQRLIAKQSRSEAEFGTHPSGRALALGEVTDSNEADASSQKEIDAPRSMVGLNVKPSKDGHLPQALGLDLLG